MCVHRRSPVSTPPAHPPVPTLCAQITDIIIRHCMEYGERRKGSPAYFLLGQEVAAAGYSADPRFLEALVESAYRELRAKKIFMISKAQIRRHAIK